MSDKMRSTRPVVPSGNDARSWAARMRAALLQVLPARTVPVIEEADRYQALSQRLAFVCGERRLSLADVLAGVDEDARRRIAQADDPAAALLSFVDGVTGHVDEKG